MKNLEALASKARELYQKAAPGLGKAGEILRVLGIWIWRLRKFVFAIPIVYWAVYLGRLNYSRLPEMVGINLQNTGDYAMYITRDAATYGPLAVTAVCLIMMFLSRKTLYPWLICLFSLLIPLLILAMSIFPA